MPMGVRIRFDLHTRHNAMSFATNIADRDDRWILPNNPASSAEHYCMPHYHPPEVQHFTTLPATNVSGPLAEPLSLCKRTSHCLGFYSQA
jgi:hypothetical protein